MFLCPGAESPSWILAHSHLWELAKIALCQRISAQCLLGFWLLKSKQAMELKSSNRELFYLVPRDKRKSSWQMAVACNLPCQLPFWLSVENQQDDNETTVGCLATTIPPFGISSLQKLDWLPVWHSFIRLLRLGFASGPEEPRVGWLIWLCVVTRGIRGYWVFFIFLYSVFTACKLPRVTVSEWAAI